MKERVWYMSLSWPYNYPMSYCAQLTMCLKEFSLRYSMKLTISAFTLERCCPTSILHSILRKWHSAIMNRLLIFVVLWEKFLLLRPLNMTILIRLSIPRGFYSELGCSVPLLTALHRWDCRVRGRMAWLVGMLGCCSASGTFSKLRGWVCATNCSVITYTVCSHLTFVWQCYVYNSPLVTRYVCNVESGQQD